MKFDAPVWPPDWPEIRNSVNEAMRTGEWGRYDSSLVSVLCTEVSRLFQGAAVRLCCSGTAALEIALRMAKVQSGDEVVLAGYDFPGNFRTVELLGARPVLAEICEETLSIAPQQLESFAVGAESSSIKVVVASHLYGAEAETRRLREICDQAGWLLIEDLCQSIGLRSSAGLAGTHGHFTTLSFGGSKPVSAGNGGALVVNDQHLAARLGPWMDRPGEVYPMSPLQAAVLIPQLNRIEEMSRQRQQNWQRLRCERIASFDTWKWLAGSKEGLLSNPYKIAWLAENRSQRDRIIQHAVRIGLPIGAGYRSLAKTSDRRCRKPVPCPLANQFGDSLFVLDHRALLVSEERFGELIDAMDELYAIRDQF